MIAPITLSRDMLYALSRDRVHIHLVLLHEAAHGCHLGNPRDALQGELKGVILHGAQFRQVVLPFLIDEGIGKSPAQARGIRAEHRVDIGGDLVSHRLDVLEDTAPRPVDVRSLFEDHIDERRTEEGESADRLDLGRGKECGGYGVGDLVLHQVRAAAGPLGIDDHLGVGEVRQGIERCPLQSPDAPEDSQRGDEDNEKLVPRAPVDDLFNHTGLPVSMDDVMANIKPYLINSFISPNGLIAQREGVMGEMKELIRPVKDLSSARYVLQKFPIYPGLTSPQAQRP